MIPIELSPKSTEFVSALRRAKRPVRLGDLLDRLPATWAKSHIYTYSRRLERDGVIVLTQEDGGLHAAMADGELSKADPRTRAPRATAVRKAA